MSRILPFIVVVGGFVGAVTAGDTVSTLDEAFLSYVIGLFVNGFSRKSQTLTGSSSHARIRAPVQSRTRASTHVAAPAQPLPQAT